VVYADSYVTYPASAGFFWLSFINLISAAVNTVVYRNVTPAQRPGAAPQ